MARLHFIRHGQASFWADDYDRLSSLGVLQSKRSGERFARLASRKRLRVISGGMRRHLETVKALGEGLGCSICHEVDEGWNEVDHARILMAERGSLPDMEAFRQWCHAQPEPVSAFQLVYDAALARWASGVHDEDYAESYAAYVTRVGKALKAATPTRDELLIVTSGGPISTVIQSILGLSDERSRDIQQVLVNAGITTLSTSGGRVRLLSFNRLDHLEADDGSFITSR